MTKDPSDPQLLAAELERLFAQAEGTEIPTRRGPARPPPPQPDPPVADEGTSEGPPQSAAPEPALAASAILAHVDQQMDVLRHELEAAFDEVVTKVEGTQQRVIDESRAVSLLSDHIVALTQELQRHREQSPAEGERVELGPLEHRVEGLAERVDAVSAAIREQLAATVREDPDGDDEDKDLRLITEALERIERDVTGNRVGLARLETVVREHDDGPGPAATNIEEIVRRGTVANAADIANLRTEVETLVAAIRDQQAANVEMRKQMEWIRQRLLGR